MLPPHKTESTAFFRACARFCAVCRFSFGELSRRSPDGQVAMSATYFISCGTKSAKRAENPCPSRKYLASTAIYRLYTFCCQFARGFFRISDKKLFCIKALFRPVLLSRFSTVKVKLFHEKLSQLHKLQGGGAEKAVCCFSADSLLGQTKRFKMPSAVLWASSAEELF